MDVVRVELADDPTVDITTTRRHTGLPRRIEIWMLDLDGRFFITGTPGQRDFLANLHAAPSLVAHLKRHAHLDLAARAIPVTDAATRRAVLEHLSATWYRSHQPLDALVETAPMVEVMFVKIPRPETARENRPWRLGLADNGPSRDPRPDVLMPRCQCRKRETRTHNDSCWPPTDERRTKPPRCWDRRRTLRTGATSVQHARDSSQLRWQSRHGSIGLSAPPVDLAGVDDSNVLLAYELAIDEAPAGNVDRVTAHSPARDSSDGNATAA